MNFSVSAGSYPNALIIAKTLRSLGITVTIPANCVLVKCTPEQVDTVKNICQTFNAETEAIIED